MTATLQIVHGWLLKAYPDLVARSCFVDPVCFCTSSRKGTKRVAIDVLIPRQVFGRFAAPRSTSSNCTYLFLFRSLTSASTSCTRPPELPSNT